MLNIITIPAFNDNYIWLVQQQDNENCIVIDPGDAVPVMKMLQKHQLKLESILITHHHPDHTGGLKSLVLATGASVYGPRNENITGLDYKLVEDDVVALPKSGLEFSVIEVPGHTSGHIAYLTEDALFCGDTLFAGGCGRLFEGTAEQMLHSLSKIMKLPDNTRIFCAHEYTQNNLAFALAVEPENTALMERIESVNLSRANDMPTVPSLLYIEKATNPFLRTHQPSIIQAAQNLLGEPPKSQIETFATIRQWKDSF